MIYREPSDPAAVNSSRFDSVFVQTLPVPVTSMKRGSVAAFASFGFAVTGAGAIDVIGASA